MENDILNNIKEDKVYTQKTIIVSAFFGGLLASGYMIYKNFKTFGYEKKATQTILFTIFLFLLLVSTIFIPPLEKIPGFYFTIFFTLLTSFLTKRFQSELIAKYLMNEGKTYSTTNAVLVCVVNIAILILFILSAYIFQDIITGKINL